MGTPYGGPPTPIHPLHTHLEGTVGKIIKMIYVDTPRWKYRGQLWCHMAADNLDELHAFAERLGCRRAWFQCPPKVWYPHYDLAPSRRILAVELGATEVDTRIIVAKTKLLRQEFLCNQSSSLGVISPVVTVKARR